MPLASSIFLVLSLVLAVLFGPQTRPWTWGPSITALGLAVLATIPSFWRGTKHRSDFGMLGLGVLTAAWFAWRASTSPVTEFAQADGILLAVAVAAFLATRASLRSRGAGGFLLWGIAILLMANLVAAGMEMANPDFSPLLPKRTGSGSVTGFFTHYNEAANYFIASSMILAGAALFGRGSMPNRCIFLTLALAGLAAVYFTNSRGGILGATFASGTLAGCGLLLGRKRRAKWFGPAVIVVPIVIILIGAALYFGWMAAQEKRHADSGIAGLLDNNARLYFLGIVLSCIGLHPAIGGGSRSFSWECFRFVEGKSEGDIITHRPEFVHNELLQSASDYGLIGMLLILGLLAALIIGAIVRTAFEETDPADGEIDMWRVAGLAALIGMLVQSCFSFVFHLLPGVVLLGICLGMASLSRTVPRNARTIGVSTFSSIAAIGGAMILVFFGWKGIRVSRLVWETYFGKVEAVSTESRIDALGTALRIWPSSAFHQDRAEALHIAAGNPEEPAFSEFAERAIDDYRSANLLHPYDPGFVVNEANLLSLLARNEEAERSYAKAINLQGGMEPAFRAHFSAANHYLNKALREFRSGSTGEALNAIERSAGEIESAVDEMHWTTEDLRAPRVATHENLGTIREAVDDPEGAIEAYQFAAQLPGGRHVHYRTAVLLGRQAVDAWKKRRSAEAMALFLKAKSHVNAAGGQLPAGITASQRLEFVQYLDRTIDFLKGARIQPAE
ncbi:MAG: tetratricopeptide repeat protein [Akkermansiaceae bacterium]|nr:tetratricopeptide repeat protein [Akkermansiaceae bacterium]MCP5545534.1 tetratricopeptide repeat protein [Akkermansiaceae bacterium]MCP5546756.1 tetratricopeptide repeat protein [Akkermansiaceae bacterium]